MPKNKKRVAAGKRSRRKGSRFEREVAKILSEWWGAEFARTPLSGGFATKSFRDDWNAAGDLVTPDSTFPFCVECKNNESWDFNQLLTSDKSALCAWWKQTVEECSEGLEPLLIFTRNYQPTYFMMRRDAYTFPDGYSRIEVNVNGYDVIIGFLGELVTLPKDTFNA